MSFQEIILIMIIATIVHEIGHLIGAKVVGIKIKEASLGFGPILWEFTLQSIKFKVCWILLGGYVMPAGSDEEFLTYSKKRRIILTASGLIMSIIILPLFSLVLIKLIEGDSFHVGIKFVDLIHVFSNHPFQYFYSGLTIFPTTIYSNEISNYLSCLAEISLFLGIVNALPIPVLDGGQIIMTLLENKMPKIKDKYTIINSIGYLIIVAIILLPMIEVFLKNIKTTFPIILFIGFIIYRVVRINHRFEKSSKDV
ncbi:site-2 protease family protein (plasmid) [Priestia megaterium]|uniref:site-2 protease family protein n=1 Tax=Priestia megaterium TaxID=1404 RepID=UPI001EDC77E4|nr:site-2 protease family protein [Priestia megaterium]UKJ83521.1 site-2 protease family protein [Priestia megaterium]